MNGVFVQLDSNKRMGFIETKGGKRYPFEILFTDETRYKLYDKVYFDLDNTDSSWMFCINLNKLN